MDIKIDKILGKVREKDTSDGTDHNHKENGFEDKSTSTISFNDGNRTFSIQPVSTSFEYYVSGVVYTSTGDTLEITNVEGIHVIYYDGDTITEAVNPTSAQVDVVIRTKAIVSIIYWSVGGAESIYTAEERHGHVMSPSTHAYLHFIEGLRYLSGLGLNTMDIDGDGDDTTAAQFGIDSGGITDEDLYFATDAVTSVTGLPIYHMTGTGLWHRTVNAGFSVRTFDNTVNTRLAYNQFIGGAWQLTEVSNADFVLCHVFATTEKDKPMIAIMGQNIYTSKRNARTGAKTEVQNLILNDVLFPEIRAIATVIFQTRNTYDNDVQARVISTEEGDNFIDWRSETVSRVELTSSDHNSLSNLDGGTYHLEESQHTDLTDAGDTILHKHDTLYYTETELNAGQLDNRYYTETETNTLLDAKVAISGNETITGIKTFSSFPITPSSAPTTDYQVANKKYVDDSGGGGSNVEDGTANGQLVFWDTTEYKHTEITEIKWDDSNKRLDMNCELYVDGESTVRNANALGTGNCSFYAGTDANSATAVYSTGVGVGVFSALTSGASNTAFGCQSLNLVQNGSSNSAFGLWSLKANISGSYNTALGRQALYSNTNSNNTAVGYQSLNANVGGYQNTACGRSSMALNISGNRNSAFGYGVLGKNTSGSNSCAYGYQSLNENTTASDGCAYGAYSLSKNTSGDANSAFGASALEKCTTGGSNTACGRAALQDNLTGTGSTAVGRNALTNATHYYNTAVGAYALAEIIGTQGNCALGYYAGSKIVGGGNNTTGTQSVFIGRDTKASANGQSNEIVIGYNAEGNGSNTVTLGHTTISDTYLRGTIHTDNGWTGTFLNGDGNTVAVTNGLITGVA